VLNIRSEKNQGYQIFCGLIVKQVRFRLPGNRSAGRACSAKQRSVYCPLVCSPEGVDDNESRTILDAVRSLLGRSRKNFAQTSDWSCQSPCQIRLKPPLEILLKGHFAGQKESFKTILGTILGLFCCHYCRLTWPEVFSKYNVPEKDAEIIGKDINHRLNKIDVSLKKTYRSRFHP